MALSSRARLAAILWTVLAIVVWNVVFDRVIVDAGRDYAKAAQSAIRESGRPLLIDDWMRPAATRAFWWATTAGSAIAVVGFAALAWAVRGRDDNARHAGDVPPRTSSGFTE